MAGAGYKLYSTGDVLTASDVNTYIQQQTVMVFADASARTTALTGVVAEGMLTYLKDTDAVEKYNGSAWVSVAGTSSPLTTKGDLYTYTTTNARLGVGNNGENLVADSSATTGLRWQGNYAAGKNNVLNGDFGIWQRGTSFSLGGSSVTNTADRFQFFKDGTHTTTISQQTFTPGNTITGYEPQFYLRFNCTASTSSTTVIMQTKIEDVRRFAGQTVTFSFWAKADSSRSISNILFTQNFGTGGSSQVDTSFSTSTASLTTSWQRFTTTLTVPSISGKTIGTGSYIQVGIYLPTTTCTIETWGWQLEAGNTATAFQTATGTVQGELAACQRYYTRFANGAAYARYGYGFTTSTTNANVGIPLPVTMRVTPTALDSGGNWQVLDVTSTGGSSSVTSFGLIANNSSPSQVVFDVNAASGLTDDRFCMIRANNDSTAYIGFSSEL